MSKTTADRLIDLIKSKPNKVMTVDLMVDFETLNGGWVRKRKSYDIHEGYDISLTTSPEGFPIIGLRPAKVKKRKK